MKKVIISMAMFIMFMFILTLTVPSVKAVEPNPPVETDTQFRRISVAEYRDKMKAGWIGQIAGVCWGEPTEGKYLERIIPEEEMPKWIPEMINGTGSLDDLYVEMTFLRTLEIHGVNVSPHQAGIDFANSEYQLWAANNAGRNNLRRGIAPPDCGHPAFNGCADDIDYQIEADYSGLIAPGLPNVPIELGNKFGRLMNYGDGVYGGMFVGAMYCEAFFETDPVKIIETALKAIPADSQYAEMVRDLLAWYKENPNDWIKTWEKIEAKYQKNPEYRKFDSNQVRGEKLEGFNIGAKINGAYILVGLLYGKGDLDQTIIISTRCGQDSDCNPSNAAGVLFTTLGFSKVPARFTEKLDEMKKYPFTDYNVPELLDVCEKLARQFVVREGGRIEKDASGAEVFVIPVKKAVPPKSERSWEPNPSIGSRYTDEERARIKIHQPLREGGSPDEALWRRSPLHDEMLRAYENNDIDISLLPPAEANKAPQKFFFGLENRRKMVFEDGKLSDFITKETLFSFPDSKVEIRPWDYSVIISQTVNGKEVRTVVNETEKGVFINDKLIDGTDKIVRIPHFKEYKYPVLMKVLYHEIMFMIIDGVPYARLHDFFHGEKGKPGPIVWYRDVAVVGLFLEAIGRVDAIENFIVNINEMYDANRDVKEPDNLGQILYLQSLVKNPNRKLIQEIVDEAKKICDADGNLTGTTDGMPCSAYQNGWLLFGLKRLGMEKEAVLFNPVSTIDGDNYSRLLWFTLPQNAAALHNPEQRIHRNRFFMDDQSTYADVPGEHSSTYSYGRLFPYIAIGQEHFAMRLGKTYRNPILTQIVYPITWGDKTRPHIWHAVELIMYLMELKSEERVLVTDFGAKPNSKENAVEAVSAAIESCRNKGSVTLVFPKGRYDFFPIPEKNRHEALMLNGVKNLTIDGEGSEFICHGVMSIAEVEGCEKITFKNFSADWEKPFAAQGEIVAVSDEYVDIHFDRGKYPFDIENDRLVFPGEGWMGGLEWHSSESARVHGLFDPKTKDMLYQFRGLELLDRRVEKIAGDVVRFHTKVRRKPPIGTLISMALWSESDKEGKHGFRIRSSKDIILRNVDIFHALGTGVHGLRTENLTLNNVNIKPNEAKERVFSAAYDGFHLPNMKGLVKIENCDCSGMGDDWMNIYGLYLVVIQRLDNRTVMIQVPRANSSHRGEYKANDEIWFVDGHTWQRKESAVIETIEPAGTDGEIVKERICFKEDIPAWVGEKTAIENKTFNAELEVRHCKINKRNAARGILVTTPLRTVIEHNVFRSTGAAILIEGDIAGPWFDSGGCGDVLIRNNVFEDCFTSGDPSQTWGWGKAVITILPWLQPTSETDAAYHRNIRIENNEFKHYDPAILFALSVDGLQFRNNTIERSRNYPPFTNRPMFFFDGCRNVLLEGNRYGADVPGKDVRTEHMNLSRDIRIKDPDIRLHDAQTEKPLP